MIVLTTPTGQIGRLLLAALTTAGADLRVIARDPARLTPAVRGAVDVVPGSHADPDVLDKAFSGADQVFWLVPPAPSAPTYRAHFDAFTTPLTKALTAHAVRRVVTVSTLGRGIARDAGLISATLDLDDAIRATGVAHRAVCPPFLMENLLRQADAIRDTGVLRLPSLRDRVLRTCAVADVAGTSARLLLDGTWSGQRDVPVVGPDTLTPEGMATTLGEVLGRHITFEQATLPDQAESLRRTGAPEGWIQGMTDMTRALNEQDFYGSSAPSTPANAPTGLRAWAKAHLSSSIR
ncbi:NAD(P)H-binding protein [Streptomyces niveiscabiei]|uniref:NAD(P)H-binding protein n=1 Tax=Streptomyces niveiscabiei TaxID=164115 RepID=UPI0029AE521D|nr:NAD(P)H-binding protein [Streptomyces niveiscabiei]MDX3380533.1 NAD(P)H-binding protein [Streptomyces niveiscabiei]